MRTGPTRMAHGPVSRTRTRMRASRWTHLPAAVVLLGSGVPASGAEADSSCGAPGQWIRGSDEQVVPAAQAMTALARSDVLLLGEEHDRADHHEWQTYTLAGVHAHRDVSGVGLEMLPRRTQAAIDRWVEGRTDFDTFVEESEWFEVWGFPPELYQPLLRWLRAHRTPTRGLNVDRELVRSVARRGWADTPRELRDGLERPKAPPEAYRERLRDAFSMHAHSMDETDREAALERFVLAQAVWDHAMASGLKEARESAAPGTLVVGIAGRGHVEYGHGIEHQLDPALEVGSALPVPADAACPEVREDRAAADYFFVLAPPDDDPEPELGIAMGDGDGAGIVVRSVREGGVAAEAGLEAGDRIVRAGGRAVRSAVELRARVRNQPPGSWLPLKVERDGETAERIARFPQRGE